MLFGLAVAAPAETADRFWVAGAAANWNDTANWAATTGGAGGQTVPGSSDVAKFDGLGLGNCTVNVASTTIGGMDVAAGYTGTLDLSSATITTDGDWTVSGGTITAGTSTAVFAPYGSTKTITGSHTLNHVTRSSRACDNSATTETLNLQKPSRLERLPADWNHLSTTGWRAGVASPVAPEFRRVSCILGYPIKR